MDPDNEEQGGNETAVRGRFNDAGQVGHVWGCPKRTPCGVIRFPLCAQCSIFAVMPGRSISLDAPKAGMLRQVGTQDFGINSPVRGGLKSYAVSFSSGPDITHSGSQQLAIRLLYL